MISKYTYHTISAARIWHKTHFRLTWPISDLARFCPYAGSARFEAFDKCRKQWIRLLFDKELFFFNRRFLHLDRACAKSTCHVKMKSFDGFWQ